MKYGMLFMTILAAALGFSGMQNKGQVPVLNPEQRETVRKFQLDDERIAGQIKQRQVEILQLQEQGRQNAQRFQSYAASLCKDPNGYQFDMSSDELRCIPKPTPSPTPVPTATPAQKEKK